MIVVHWIDRAEHGIDGGWRSRRAAGRALLSDTAAALGVEMPRVHRAPGRRPEAATADLWFSMSHSGALTACAVARSNVAIDVEVRGTAREHRVAQDLPARFFTPSEREAIGQDPSQFLRVFTVKEAWVKYVGVGLGLGLGGFDEAAVVAARPEVTFTNVPVDGAVCTVCHRAGDPLVSRRRVLSQAQLAAGAVADRRERER